VILHHGVGKWQRGDVISGQVLQQAGSDIDRLLALRSMRVATEVECDKGHVSLPSPEMNMSYEQVLSDKDKEIVRLSSRVSSLEEQLSAGLHLNQKSINNTNQAALIEEKDRTIATMQAQLSTLQAQVGALNLQVLEQTKLARAASAALQNTITNENAPVIQEQQPTPISTGGLSGSLLDKSAPAPTASSMQAAAPSPKEDAPTSGRATSRIRVIKNG
jgi:hypothetical protein